MNVRTTVILGMLLLLLAGGWFAFWWLQPAPVESPTVALLTSLDPKKIERVAVLKGDKTRVDLTNTGAGWKLPGNWPLRQSEVDELLKFLSSMATRYAPVPVPEDESQAKAKLEDAGLDKKTLTVKLTVAGNEHT